jgi:hypothetical protein
MILVGSQRGGGTNLAIHLLKSENEHVEIHEMRHFVSDDLVEAFQEIHGISRGTRCKKYLYSLSLNPPANETASVEDFEAAIQRIEEKLGLVDQPRAIVFHTKESRMHCHTVWSRIDEENMKAINIAYDHRKLNEIAHELFIEHGWDLPNGFRQDQEASPLNYTLEQYQQAKRAGRDAKALKLAFQECWSQSDTSASFEAALEAKGLFLARGDRRGFVAIDYHGEIYSLSRWTNVKVRELKARLGDPEQYRCVEETRTHIAERMTPVLQSYTQEKQKQARENLALFKQSKAELIDCHRNQRAVLKEEQQARSQQETQERASRFATGFKAVWEWVTGKSRRIKKQNQQEAEVAEARDQSEKEKLIQQQRIERQRLQQQLQHSYAQYEEGISDLYRDLSEYHRLGYESDVVQEVFQKSKQHQQALRYEFEQSLGK